MKKICLPNSLNPLNHFSLAKLIKHPLKVELIIPDLIELAIIIVIVIIVISIIAK
jgi:hypothetical protein